MKNLKSKFLEFWDLRVLGFVYGYVNAFLAWSGTVSIVYNLATGKKKEVDLNSEPTKFVDFTYEINDLPVRLQAVVSDKFGTRADKDANIPIAFIIAHTLPMTMYNTYIVVDSSIARDPVLFNVVCAHEVGHIHHIGNMGLLRKIPLFSTLILPYMPKWYLRNEVEADIWAIKKLGIGADMYYNTFASRFGSGSIRGIRGKIADWEVRNRRRMVTKELYHNGK